MFPKEGGLLTILLLWASQIKLWSQKVAQRSKPQGSGKALKFDLIRPAAMQAWRGGS